MHAVPAVICALIGAAAGFLVPRLVGALPEPEPDPSENPEDFPAKVLYTDLAARPGLLTGSILAGAVAAGVLGAVFGLVWGISYLLVAMPFAIALAVTDYVTWYLPNRLIWPAVVAVAATVVASAVALGEAGIVLHAVIGAVGLLLYYGIFWFISPRMLAFGDVKLGGLLGLALGAWGPAAPILSLLSAGVISVLAMIPMRRAGNTINQGGSTGLLRAHVPFGPAMLAGAWVAVLLVRVLNIA